MKRVLVTGATGFIGRHCLKPLLERGYEVHAVCHDRPVVESSSLTWHRADLKQRSLPTCCTSLGALHQENSGHRWRTSAG
jgi:nucleoside-diphosphate-sugar epimerase